MEEMLVEYVDYSGELLEIIEKQEEIILLLQEVLEYCNLITQPIWFITVVIIPLMGVVSFLWWFMKQFIQKY
ncbi:MAG: hypothetical protein GX957_13835 [Clostridiaceae bacterium]|nr:hypothetical protein [Clostridiaceae bacterium]